MAKVAKIWDGTAWVDLATSVPDLSNYQLKSEGGLTFIKKQTIGTAVSSVVVNDAFSATYDAYKIIISGGVGSANLSLNLTLTGSAASYFSAGYDVSYAGTGAAGANNNGSSFSSAGAANTDFINLDVELIDPALAKYTKYTGKYITNTGVWFQTGVHKVATSYTGFTVTTSTGTLTGGTIYVYGYNKG
jgi:hypothetical protein